MTRVVLKKNRTRKVMNVTEESKIQINNKDENNNEIESSEKEESSNNYKFNELNKLLNNWNETINNSKNANGRIVNSELLLEEMGNKLSTYVKNNITQTKKYRILRRVKNNVNIKFELPNIETKNIIKDDELKLEFDKYHKPLQFLKEEIKISPILVEDANSKGKIMSSKNVGKILSIDYLYNDLRIMGSGLKTKMISLNGKNNYYNRFNSIQETDEEVEIIDENEAKKNAIMKYNIKEGDDLNINVKLCYYSNNDSEYIVPAYHISGNKGNINLMEMIMPACKNHIPVIEWQNINVKNVEKGLYKTGPRNDDDSFKDKICFTFDVNRNMSNLELSSIYDIENRINKDQLIKIYIPHELTKKEMNNLSNVNLYISTVNKYGFSTMNKQVLNLLKYIDYFKLIAVKPLSSGTSRHNYGIEWAETPLGATIYPRFIEEMNKHAYKEYSFDSTQSKEVHFKDKENDGLDHCFVDNVDISAYIGHGSGNGITFVTSDDDSNLTFADAQGGKAWGNKDMEYMALMSCQVLRETTSNGNWAERWGPSFNGMHLMLGFQTNAYVGDHNMLKFYAENMYVNENTIMMSWFNAALNDQPDNVDAVVMGPLIKNSNTNNYKSILSSIPGLYRAHWNEKTWNVGDGPGLDVSKENVNGWWRVVITV